MLLVLSAVCFVALLPSATPQNILVILLDDVDAMPITRQFGFPNVTSFFKNKGVTFNNAFVTTPICCPSRASIFTGTYQHNHRTFDNTVDNGCDGPNWDYSVAPNSLGKRLQDMGYRTGMYGKYSNNYRGDKVPEGWTDWLGLLGNSQYYNYTVNRNGKNEKHGAVYSQDYLPSLILDAGLKFMADNSSTVPWCAFLSFPTAHETFDAAPQHQGLFKDSNPPTINFPSFNKTGDPGKHWYTRSRPPLSQLSARYNSQGWTRRLQALQTVDEGFMRILDSIDHENTTIIFTSDNGFYFGEWGMILDKRQPYESTVRVPMFASGPLFPNGESVDSVVLNIDLAPTAIDVAKKSGINQIKDDSEYGLQFDGMSMIPMAEPQISRKSFLVEYNGMGRGATANECAAAGTQCWYKDNKVWVTEPRFDIADNEKFCFCVDAKNNTFRCERHISTSVFPFEQQPNHSGYDIERDVNSQNTEPGEDFTNFLYCEFESGFNEFYNLHKDPFQMANEWPNLPEDVKLVLRNRVGKLLECRGVEECSVLDMQFNRY